MPRIFHNIPLGLDESLEEKLTLLSPHWQDYRILRQSVDARRPHRARFILSLEVADPGENLEGEDITLDKIDRTPAEEPIIVGSGPAGLFAALRFVERGIRCKLFERGSRSEERIKGINRYWRHGELDPRNNVCFGEGGAGLYSDGKLITRIKSPHIPYVLQKLVQFGAPEEIRYLSNPHVGSDKIRRVIPKLRQYLLEHGCQIFFDTKIEELLIEGNQISGVRTITGQQYKSPFVILATGHSAEDMLYRLADQGVGMEGKSFAMGLRIEHPQSLINQIQYREDANHPKLGSAQYRLAHHNQKDEVGVYSFCMCPGGYVLSSGTEPDGIVCNGMSNFNRGSRFANAAVVVSIDHKTWFGDQLFGGLRLRRQIEQKAYCAVQEAGKSKELPAQKVADFMSSRLGEIARGSSPSGEAAVRLDQILPSTLTQKIREGLSIFDQQMKGFVDHRAQLYGVETRTSCPVRVTRHPVSLQSVSHAGLYPCGEGAGYAGGITSAACDGIKVAEVIYKHLAQQRIHTYD